MNWRRLKLMRAAARVERMHTSPTLHRQTVGEHTFGVMAIIVEILPDNPSAELVGNLLLAALYHDSLEAITGDMPATLKWKHPMVEDALRHAEHLIRNDFDIPSKDLGASRILKFADLMELAITSLEEASTGNQRMLVVARNALQAIVSRGLIDVSPEAMRLYDLMKVSFEQQVAHFPNYAEVTNAKPEY